MRANSGADVLSSLTLKRKNRALRRVAAVRAASTWAARLPGEEERDECPGRSDHRSGDLPAGKRHPVELLEAERGADRDEAGKQQRRRLEDEEDEERQGDNGGQESLDRQTLPFTWSLVLPKRRSRDW